MLMLQDVNLGHEDVVKPTYIKDMSSAMQSSSSSLASKVRLSM